MTKLLLLLGFLAGTAQAADEYYSLNPILTTATALPSDPYSLPGTLVISGWLETNGFGTSGCPTSHCDGPGTEPWNPVLIGYDLNMTYRGVTESVSYVEPANSYAPASEYAGGIYTATSKGLYCNGCDIETGYPFFFAIGNAGGNTRSLYQFAEYPVNGSAAIADFWSAPMLGANIEIGEHPSTTMPGAPELDPGQAGAALMLLLGVGVVLERRPRGWAAQSTVRRPPSA